jgi:universal stress protein E
MLKGISYRNFIKDRFPEASPRTISVSGPGKMRREGFCHETREKRDADPFLLGRMKQGEGRPMKRFRNILLVCDNDTVHKSLISRAVWLAEKNGAHVTLVDTIDAAPGELARFFSALPGRGAGDLAHDLEQFHRERLAGIAEPFAAKGIKTSKVVLQGIPFIEIIKLVLNEGHDLVMKGVTGNTSASGLFFSGSDMHLLRKCPCPVWLMKKNKRREYSRVLAAVDPDPTEKPRDALNTLIMDLATSLSEAEESELHVVNAWEFRAESMLRHSGFMKIQSEEVDRIARAERKKKKLALDSLLEGYQGIDKKKHVHLIKGDARKVIPDFARKKRAELVVMGTVGRTGIQGFFIGNTAEEILNQVECSVLAVKPPGFQTPVPDEPASVTYIGSRPATAG